MKKIILSSVMALASFGIANAQHLSLGHQWTKAFASDVSYLSEQVATKIGNSGTLISATNFRRSLDVDPSPSATVTVQTPNIGNHINSVITALDQQGNYQNHIQISSNGETKIVSITTDDDNHVYILGYQIDGTVTIGSTTVTTSVSQGSYFLARLTYFAGSSFTSDWAYSFNKSVFDARFYALAVGDVGGMPALFVGGESNSGLDVDIKGAGVTGFNPGTIRQPLVIRYDVNCNYGLYSYMTTTADGNGTGVRAMEVKNGNLYMTGSYGGAFQLPSISVNIPTKGGYDVFTTKFTANNLQPVWAVRNGSLQSDYPVAIGLDASENVYVTGTFAGNNFNFNPVGTSTVNTAGYEDVFILKLTSAGAYASGKYINSDIGDAVSGMAIDPNGDFYITGRFSRTLYDGSNFLLNPSSYNDWDIYLIRGSLNGPIFHTSKIGTAHSSGASYENGVHLLRHGQYLYLSANTVRNATLNRDVDFDASPYGVASLSDYYGPNAPGVATITKYYACTAALTPSISLTSSSVTPCTAINYQLTETTGGFSSYIWGGPSGLSSNTPTLHIPAASSSYAAGNILLQVNGSNNCYGTQSSNFNFPAFPAASTSITSSSVACAGSSITFTATGTNINWYDNASSTVPVATGSVYTASYTTATSPAYVYAATTNTTTGCENPRAITVFTVEAGVPAPVIDVVNSNLSICEGQGTTIYSDNYDLWYFVPTGGSPISSGSQFSTSTLTTNTTFYVEYKPGNCPSARIPVTVTVNIMPSVLSQTVQNLTCNGSASGSISLTLNNPGSYTYQWTPNVSTTYSATGLAAGAYTVLISAGACATTQTYNLTQPAAYTPTVNISGSNTLALAGMFANTTFQWLDCNNGNAPIAGQTNTMFTPTVSGSYAALVTISGCPATSTCVTISIGSGTCNINAGVSQNGNTLSSNQNGAAYQWVDCNNSNAAISGATSQAFTPTVTGNYAVTVTSGTCVVTSACTQVNIIPTGINELNMLNTITIHPNPATTYIVLNNVADGTTVHIIDVTGKTVAPVSSTGNADKSITLHINDLPNGIYFIQLKNNGAVAHKKLIISK